MKHTALIVTFNRLEKLKKTVAETVKLHFTSIVIVNNGSTDGTSDWLQTITDPRVIVLNLASNNGGPAGLRPVVNIYAALLIAIGSSFMTMMLIRKVIFLISSRR